MNNHKFERPSTEIVPQERVRLREELEEFLRETRLVTDQKLLTEIANQDVPLEPQNLRQILEQASAGVREDPRWQKFYDMTVLKTVPEVEETVSMIYEDDLPTNPIVNFLETSPAFVEINGVEVMIGHIPERSRSRQTEKAFTDAWRRRIGKQLSKALKVKTIKRKDLQVKLGKTIHTNSFADDLLAGRRPVDRERLQQLAEVCDVPWGWFFTNEEYPVGKE